MNEIRQVGPYRTEPVSHQSSKRKITMNLGKIYNLYKYGENFRLELSLRRYIDGTPAVTSTCDTGEPFDSLTVNVDGIPDGCVAVKEENGKYVTLLHEAGVIESTTPAGEAESGFITVFFYPLTAEAKEALADMPVR